VLLVLQVKLELLGQPANKVSKERQEQLDP